MFKGCTRTHDIAMNKSTLMVWDGVPVRFWPALGRVSKLLQLSADFS